MNVKPIGNRVSPAPKKLSAKDRLIASAHRRLKNREKKLARLRSDFEMDAGVFTRQIEELRELLTALGEKP